MKKQSLPGYMSQPSIYSQPPGGSRIGPESRSGSGDVSGFVAFICDDDLWTVGLEGGRAHRITANLGVVAEPAISPDGEQIAFAGTDGGIKDIYLTDAEGGSSRRLTYLGISKLIGWKDANTLLYTSAHESTSARVAYIYELDLRSLDSKRLPVGPATDISFGSKGRMVLGRHCRDSALWKRYKGGTAGVFWVGAKGGKFSRILANVTSNLTNPHWIGEQIYFLSDIDGIAQVYRVNADGKNLKCLTNHREFYARKLNTDGRLLTYQSGGDLFVATLDGRSRKLDIQVKTPAVQAEPRFEDAIDYLQEVAISPKGEELTIIARGHGFRLKPWSEGVTELSAADPLRSRLPVYVRDGRELVFVRSDHVAAESLHLTDLKTRETKTIFPAVNWGKIWGLSKVPHRNQLVLANNRNQIFLIDLDKNSHRQIERSNFGRMSEISFSPDGKLLAYTSFLSSERTGIRLYDIENQELRWLTTPIHSDWSGSFDQTGKYFYFLSIREFYPNYNATHFDLGFPFAGRPYVVTLRRSTESPFHQFPEVDQTKTASTDDKDSKKKTDATYAAQKRKDAKTKSRATQKDDGKKIPDVIIDWEGLDNRIEALPVKIGGYQRLVGLENKVLYTRARINPIRDFAMRVTEPDPELLQYSFDKQKEEVFAPAVRGFEVNEDRSKICLRVKYKLRLIPTREIPRDGGGQDRLDGWVYTDRLRLRIDPRNEWKQMYREAWELQKEHFWDEGMSRIDWDLIYRRYLPLVDRVRTRSEMSDLLWEMQGELGTSHCYEYMGDYFRRPPMNPVGYLGGEFKFNPHDKCFDVVRLYPGDSWIEGHSCPLLGPKAGLKPGDKLIAIDGWRLAEPGDLGFRLLNKAGVEVNIEIRRKGAKDTEIISVKTLRQQVSLIYREWVNTNRAYVHKKSGGKLGYVHIPNMMSYGYSEFYRGFLTEHDHDGLVVDVRYNGGGHISQHILKVLAQKVIGYDQSRWNGVMKYPTYAVNGPVVALTNENAGSDGDIFSHSFKLMKIGPLIGKRTWGGVIGINGQYSLRDGTTTTQPEYSFWFKDVGWSVENHGTEPDIEVEFPPEAYAKGQDPQLDRAIEEGLKLARRQPPLKADLKKRPDLRLPAPPMDATATKAKRK